MTAVIEQLYEFLKSDAPLPTEARAHLLNACELHVNGGVSLDKALNPTRRGGSSPARSIALAERNQLLWRLYRTHSRWKALEPGPAAKLMVLNFRRYEANRFSRERDNLTAPDGELAATWWRILNSPAPMVGAKMLQHILEIEIHSHV